jgi:hypothetical protein
MDRQTPDYGHNAQLSPQTVKQPFNESASQQEKTNTAYYGPKELERRMESIVDKSDEYDNRSQLIVEAIEEKLGEIE